MISQYDVFKLFFYKMHQQAVRTIVTESSLLRGFSKVDRTSIKFIKRD